jgi:hypothetical protein
MGVTLGAVMGQLLVNMALGVDKGWKLIALDK